MWLSLRDKRFGSFIEDTVDTFAAAQNFALSSSHHCRLGYKLLV